MPLQLGQSTTATSRIVQSHLPKPDQKRTLLTIVSVVVGCEVFGVPQANALLMPRTRSSNVLHAKDSLRQLLEASQVFCGISRRVVLGLLLEVLDSTASIRALRHGTASWQAR
jgi:hypothetical protein